MLCTLIQTTSTLYQTRRATSLQQSRNLGVNAVSHLGRFKEIQRNVFRQLVLLCPLPDLLKIAALVLCVEVDKWLGVVRVYPELPEDADVDGAHQLLAQDIEAVCCNFYQ